VRTAIVALALSDEALSDPTSAFNTIKVGIKLSDSLQSDKKKNLIKISNLLVTSSSFLKENEALREKGELHSQRFTFQNVLITLSLLVGALLGAMLFMAKHANRRAGKLADILKAQNDELMAYKEDIQNLNNKLETEMAERTRILTQRTRQLLDYANYNSHMVRGPLARILGLNYLIDHTKNDREVRNYIEMLKESAFEMDEALRLINRKLELQEADYMKTIAIGQEKGANT
jgi:signal transduction histidine kinase